MLNIFIIRGWDLRCSCKLSYFYTSALLRDSHRIHLSDEKYLPSFSL